MRYECRSLRRQPYSVIELDTAEDGRGEVREDDPAATPTTSASNA
ncbi:hypothetical protein [Saccharopolyspora elongata]|nr:hypothetical protein [Saccharopolyspora elongata]